MADLDAMQSGQEGHFDNDFEKLDPFAAPQEAAVSSTQDEAQEIYGSERGGVPENIQQPLLDIDPTPSTVPEPVPQLHSEPLVEDSKPVSSSKSCWIKNIDPRVIDLVYWRDVKKTAVVFGSLLVLLLSLACFSVLSVLAYLSLALLTVTISFVAYKKIMAAVQKTSDGHPFRKFLEIEVSLPEDKLHQLADNGMKHFAQTVKELRRYFLVEDLVDSLKFGLMLWVLTYIGAWFNGMTLLILALIGVFSIPKFYETYKVQIDDNVELIKGHTTKIISQVKEKLPMPGKAKTAKIE